MYTPVVPHVPESDLQLAKIPDFVTPIAADFSGDIPTGVANGYALCPGNPVLSIPGVMLGDTLQHAQKETIIGMIPGCNITSRANKIQARIKVSDSNVAGQIDFLRAVMWRTPAGRFNIIDTVPVNIQGMASGQILLPGQADSGAVPPIAQHFFTDGVQLPGAVEFDSAHDYYFLIEFASWNASVPNHSAGIATFDMPVDSMGNFTNSSSLPGDVYLYDIITGATQAIDLGSGPNIGTGAAGFDAYLVISNGSITDPATEVAAILADICQALGNIHTWIATRSRA